MVDHIAKVAEILSQPDLEDDTKRAINEFIRAQLQARMKDDKANPDPFKEPDGMKEWLEGPQKGGDG